MINKKDLKLSQSTIEKLNYYVYLLVDKKTNKPFYVGKGKGNRINHHFKDALDKETKKSEKIKKILSAKLDVQKIILRHSLTERESFAVESSLIDYIGIDNLANIVKGHDQKSGIADLEELKIRYEAEEADFKNDSVVLININRKYKQKMTQEEIYEVVRGNWKVDINKVRKINIVCAVSQGIIRGVFEQQSWSKILKGKDKNRSCFEGKIASKNLVNKYLHKSVKKYWPVGSQNPIKYVVSKNRVNKE